MSTIKMSANPRKKLTLKEDFSFNDKLYKKGHVFHPTGYDYIRGYDLEDSDGNVICEVRMIMDKFDISDVTD